MRLPTVLLFAAVLLGAASPMEAQVRLYGRIADEATGAAIAGAEVVLVDERGRPVGSRTVGDDGEFEFLVRRNGPYTLHASRFGYLDATSPRLWLGEHSIVRVELRLDANALLLAPLEVVARSPARGSAVLANYHARLRAGVGNFLTREDIDRMRPARISDALATIPGVFLQSGGGIGASRVVTMSRAMGGCPAQIFVDGFLINRRGAFAVDEFVTPGAVEGVEVYRGMATVPAEFLTPEGSRCGVVAIWTRRGDA
jgi:hypothetical protein